MAHQFGDKKLSKDLEAAANIAQAAFERGEIDSAVRRE
jgi:hypothetical protein